MEFDVWLVMGKDPRDGRMIPMACCQTKDGAQHVADEAADNLTLAYSLSPDRFRVAVQEVIASLKVVPGEVFVDEEDFDNA